MFLNTSESFFTRSKESTFYKVSLIIVAISVLFCFGCSVPNSEEELKTRMVNAAMDIEVYNSMKPELIEGVDLNKALELGLTYNLELWLAKQELAIKKEIKFSSIAKMLPQLTVDINNGIRDSHNASSSVGLFTGENAELVSYSYSDMKNHTYGGVNLLWNVLDFGVSYFRMKQSAKQTRHALHEIRRIKQKLTYDITQAYWQCVSMRKILDESIAIESEINEELAAIDASLKNGRIRTSEAIERRYPLKSQKIKINDYKELFHGSKLRLGQLMGLPVGADFTIITYIDNNLFKNLNIEELEEIALNRRPELFQEDLQESITRDEAKATILQMLPSPQMFINPQMDDNKHLYYDSWLTAGLSVSWNLFDIPNKIFSTKAQYKRMDFIRKKRMALAVAIITQLRIAGIEYDYAIDRYNSLNDLANDSKEMIKAAEQAMKAGKAKKSAIINKKLGALSDYAASMEAYTRVMVAKARIYNTAGIDPENNDLLLTQPIFDENNPANKNIVYLNEDNTPISETGTIEFIQPSTPIVSSGYSNENDIYVLEQY